MKIDFLCLYPCYQKVYGTDDLCQKIFSDSQHCGICRFFSLEIVLYGHGVLEQEQSQLPQDQVKQQKHEWVYELPYHAKT